MTLKTLMIASCLTILVACASNHAKPPAIAPSGGASISESQVFSAETKARLKKIQDDYGVVVIVTDHQIAVGTAGAITKERMKTIEDALHEVVGKDFTVIILTD